MKIKHLSFLSVCGVIVFTASSVKGAAINQTTSDALGFSSFNSAGITQQETATAAGTITTAGSLAVTVTSTNVTGSPLTINVPVALGDTAAIWSPKVVTALNANAAIAAQFTAGGTAPAIVLTGKVVSPTIPATDATLNIAIAAGTAAGITPVTTSANTRGVTYTWSDTLAPKAGNTYSTNGLALRTPPTSDSAFTFGGDSLTVETKSVASGAGATMLLKNTGNQTLTFTNLIMNGGIIGHGQGGVTTTLAGAIAANVPSGFSISDNNDNRAISVSAPITGTGRLYVGSFNSYSASGYTPVAYTNTFTVSGNNSGFSGGWSLGGGFDATFFNGATTYTTKFAASATTFKVNHANALGTGTLELKEGILNLNGFSPAGLAGVQIPNSGTPTVRSAGSTLTATAFNIGTTAGASFKIDTAGAGNPATAPIVSTSLAVNGPTTLSVLGTGLAVGTFPLIAYSGTIGGTNGFSDLSLALPPGVTGNLTNTAGSSVNVTISGIEFIKWTNGAATGNWDTTAVNWKTTTGLVDSAYQQNAAGGNSVLFNESEAAPSPVAIAIPSSVSPNAISISNPLKDYTFSGAGGITGTCALTKNGAANATFPTALSYTGNTTINGGHLTLTGATGLASGTVAIASGAFLTYNNPANLTQGAASAAGITFSGAGTLEKKGSTTLVFANGTGPVNWNFGAGALIDVQGGKLTGGSNNNDIWTNNKASLNIATGATFESTEANVTVDGLTGGGIYQAGWYGPRDLKVGVNGGSGNFSGSIQSNGGDPNNSVTLIKVGTGTQTISGAINIKNTYSGTTLQTNGGTLVISPTLPSVIGSTISQVFVSPGTTDVSTLTQTSGTLTTSNFSIGQQGAATYNISGGIVNAAKIDMAFTGPTTGSGAVAMNVSGTAQVNLNSNGGILMGQYYGRPVTVTQSGGNVVCYSDAGITRGGTGGGLRFLGGNTATSYNLNGGTLSIPAITYAASGSGAGGGNGTINFNGGILQVTSASFAVPTGNGSNGNPRITTKVLGDNLTPDSGARIDNYGLAISFATPLIHSGSSAYDGGLSLENSVAGGSLTLTGVNTYSGNTAVAASGNLILAANAELRFLVIGTETNKLTGTGGATLQGNFLIDTTAAKITNGNSWTLVDVASCSYDPLTFTVIGFTPSGTDWIQTDGAKTWTFSQATGKLTLAVTYSGGFATWMSGFSVSDPSPGADPDNDGMDNLLEYVLNGDPGKSDPAILPGVALTSTDYVFSFTRRVESEADSTQVFEYGSNLTGWTPLSITAPTAAEVSLGTPTGDVQTVTVTIPRSYAIGDKLFGRLHVTQPSQF
ncbi:MAG: hypothetical protein WCK77_00005 [Verrucomicrobiota bacterium]